jgi:toxin-antitoxin system PIN domain toxin
MFILPDINVLLARFDAKHEAHPRTAAWFRSRRLDGMLTCPLTENGFVRIFSNPSYPSGPGSMPDALVMLECIRSVPGHRFIADSISLGETTRFTGLSAAGPSQLTDLYLLALAVEQSAKFVTLDDRIPAHLVKGGKSALIVIPR